MTRARIAILVGAVLLGAIACDATINTDGLTGGLGGASVDAAIADASSALVDATVHEDAGEPSEDAATPVDATTDSGDDVADAAPADASVDAQDPDLIVLWTFEEDGGTIAHDRSGHDATNYLQLTPGATIGGVGHSGGALQMQTGGSAYATALPAFPLSATLSYWVKYTYPDGGAADRDLFDGYDAQHLHFYMLSRGPDSFAMVVQGNGPVDPMGSKFWLFQNNLDIPQSAWHHVVVVSDFPDGGAGTFSYALYLDAFPVTGFSASFAEDGGIEAQGVGFSGGFGNAIDDVRLYKRAMAAPEAELLP